MAWLSRRIDLWADGSHGSVAPVAPVLSAATGVALTSTTASIGVTTTDNSGTMYWVVDTGSQPSAAQIKLGQNSAGGAANASGNSTVTSTSYSTTATGLTASTTYFAYFVQVSANTLTSNVVASGSFATPAAPAGFTPVFPWLMVP